MALHNARPTPEDPCSHADQRWPRACIGALLALLVVASADYVDINQFLKPANPASYNIVFAHGRMFLAWSATSGASLTSVRS